MRRCQDRFRMRSRQSGKCLDERLAASAEFQLPAGDTNLRGERHLGRRVVDAHAGHDARDAQLALEIVHRGSQEGGRRLVDHLAHRCRIRPGGSPDAQKPGMEALIPTKLKSMDSIEGPLTEIGPEPMLVLPGSTRYPKSLAPDGPDRT